MAKLATILSITPSIFSFFQKQIKSKTNRKNVVFVAILQLLFPTLTFADAASIEEYLKYWGYTTNFQTYQACMRAYSSSSSVFDAYPDLSQLDAEIKDFCLRFPRTPTPTPPSPSKNDKSEGDITFIGKISATTCRVDTTNKNITVNLPTVRINELPRANATAGKKSFSLIISGCNAVANNARAYFEPGDDIDMNTGYLKNRKTQGAQNVQIQLLNSDSSAIQLNQPSGAQNVTWVNNTANQSSVRLNYFAQYIATGQATAGEVQSVVNYTIEYQ